MLTWKYAGNIFSILVCILSFLIIHSRYIIKDKNAKIFYGMIMTITLSCFSMILFQLTSLPLFYSIVPLGIFISQILLLEYILNLFTMSEKFLSIVRLLTYPTYILFFFDINHTYLFSYMYLFIIIILVANYKKMVWYVFRCLLIGVCFANLVLMIYYIFGIDYTFSSSVIIIFTLLFLFHGISYDSNIGSLDLKAFSSYLKYLQKKEQDFFVLNLYLKKDILNEDETFAKKFSSYVQDIFKGISYTLFKVSDKHFMLVGVKDKDMFRMGLLETKIKYGLSLIYDIWGVPYQLLYIDSTPELEIDDYISIRNFLYDPNSLNSCKICSQLDLANYKKYKLINDTIDEIQTRQVLDDDRIVVHYQPIFDNNGECHKAEALMRLNINGEMYYPKDFLPVVEKENYSHFITKAVLNKVCKHIKQLEHEKYNFDKISVNLSTEDLLINDGYKTLINIVEKVNGISFEKIAFEILEGTDKVSYEPLVKTMIALKSVTDVEFYLDDFGTGYSNLSRLLSLPISIVKFDKSILKNMRTNPVLYTTIKSNVQILKEQGYEVLFEGVEDQPDIDLCKKMGTNYYQGYMYTKPGDISILKKFFEKLG